MGVDWIELDKIGGMSRFRSGIGHDFSHLDVYEEWSCRSMKHYYFMRSSDNLTNVFSPVNAEVIELIGEGKGDEANTRITGQSVGLSNVQVRMRVTDSDYTAFVVILFHVDLGVLLRVGDTISAGQLLGKKSEQVNGLDIAIYADTPQGKRLVSYFDVINDNVFQEYVNRGVVSREMMIISKKQRDANLLSCTGVYFDHPGSLPGLVSIDESGKASLIGGTGYSPQGYQGEESSSAAGGGTGPNIEYMNCTEGVQVNKMVECSFKYSGSVDRVAWLAPGGNPEEGKEYRFTTQYYKSGTYVITLEACKKYGCTLKAQDVDVVDASTTMLVRP